MMELLPYGNNGVLLNFKQEISEETHKLVRDFYYLIQKEFKEIIVSIIPAYCSITLVYKVESISFEQLSIQLKKLCNAPKKEQLPPGKTVDIPVCYDRSFAPDMEHVCAVTGLSEKEVIQLHTGNTYLVYMLGFTPGFPYMGLIDEKLSVPRRTTPRLKIPAGSVGLANRQTGIYPLETPGGWNIIGRTPVIFFDPEGDFSVQMGDEVRFRSISKSTFEKLQKTKKATSSLPENTSDTYHEVIAPGQFTTIQDGGRWGYEAFGIPNSGFLDRASAMLANQLVGNPEHAALLELTFTGPTIKFGAHCGIAITGADLSPLLNGKPINNNKSYEVERGDILSFGHLKSGCRAYLAFSGTLLANEAFGSKATYIYASLGGIEGRPIKKGDRLFVQPKPLPKGRQQATETFSPENEEVTIMKGPEFHLYGERFIEAFLNPSYTISEASNRMGYRLTGGNLPASAINNIISSGIVRGTIQLPASGDPIVLLNDAGTVEGYPRIGVCIAANVDRLVQKKPGDKVVFSLK